ncbi:hypothetical protein T484DRAFT_1746269 [Baffinella frigidus]|nr:hypothetical protein T484DRAFT_1746269 [Cryptophyta sp. CCMP2293]
MCLTWSRDARAQLSRELEATLQRDELLMLRLTLEKNGRIALAVSPWTSSKSPSSISLLVSSTISSSVKPCRSSRSSSLSEVEKEGGTTVDLVNFGAARSDAAVGPSLNGDDVLGEDGEGVLDVDLASTSMVNLDAALLGAGPSKTETNDEQHAAFSMTHCNSIRKRLPTLMIAPKWSPSRS